MDLPTSGFAVQGNVVIGPDASGGKVCDGLRKVVSAHDLEGSFATDSEHLGYLGVGHDRWWLTHEVHPKRVVNR
jgi:hypothetical protein